MLAEIRITDLGVIAEATVELAPGFTVVTGETGAGKTMVVAGLTLLFGGRADASRVRAGASKALVEGRLRCPDTTDMRNALTALGLDLPDDLDDDGALLVSRTVAAGGRTRGHVAGRQAPVAFLAELGEQLVALHGQSDQLRLLRPGEQRAALDRFGGDEIAQLAEAHRATFRQWQQIITEISERTSHTRERAQRAELLKLGLAEVEATAPQPGEDAELRTEIARLTHAEGLRLAAGTAHQALSGDPTADDVVDVVGLLGTAQKALEEQATHDEQLAALARRSAEVAALVGELATDLASYQDGIDVDPARLAAAHERAAQLAGLIRKYADDAAGVLAWAEEARRELLELDSSSDVLDELRNRRDQLHGEVTVTAVALSRARRVAAGDFAERVTTELAGLAMPHARIEVAVTTQPATSDEAAVEVEGQLVAVTADGIDTVELLLVQPGAAPVPIHRGASGGELSRVMLAIEVVFAGIGGPPVMIFDEVDAGVGGKAAVEIGRRLARLAATHQVLVVTHLPQVAAFADHHLVVEKDSSGAVTTSGVRAVLGNDRARELARMLAGMQESDLGLAHAQELLELAQSQRSALTAPSQRSTAPRETVDSRAPE